MERKLILAGVGGQGVVYATKVLSQAAVLRGDSVLASENHGMSQRGGSVMSHLKIGGSQSPLIRRGTADAILAFDPVEAVANVVVLGFAAAHGELGLTVDDLKAAVRSLGPARAVETNFQALEMGAATSSRRPAEEQRNEAL
ncbi:MAG: 2-oxoacid:acceptor oxidoreductase family protein [Chloroflexi bacterium]|nr:2-oxoacid:acceptor oxidoreductase family protein [Chloroflexota bacterium]